MTKPVDKTIRTVAERTRTVLRVNRQSLSHVLPPLSDKNPKRYVSGGAVLMPKLPGQALPSKSNIWERNTYRTGDGEVFQQMRPGAEDALKFQSRGFKT